MLLNSKYIITPAAVLNNNYIITQVKQMSTSISLIPDTYAGEKFKKTINLLLNSAGFKSYFVPSILDRPIEKGCWAINLNDHLANITESDWRRKNFRLVLHAQDFCHYYNNSLCTELHFIEQQLTPEQQMKTIFVHWDHGLSDLYIGNIKCVEFASHSYELVHALHTHWDRWKEVHNKDIKYNFICLNGWLRKHRIELYEILKDIPTGFTTHINHNPAPMHPYCNYNFNNVENFVKLMPLYQQAKASIVSETIYADHPGIITEKTLLAIAAKHPFMCIGHQGIHREIAERGFENFNELFDLSYDTLASEHRLDAAMDLNLYNLSDSEWDVVCAQEKTERNFDFLMNGYTKSIEQRFLTRLKNC